MIKGIIQPDIIQINSNLRLRKFDGNFDFALEWYQDIETVKLVDGDTAKKYDKEKLSKMYNYLDKHGELYFIEALEMKEFIPIGDVTFWQDDMPIVIGNKNYRGHGIGELVIKALIERAKSIGYKTIYVNEIYSYNKASISLFKKLGFEEYRDTALGFSYCLNL